MRIARVCKQFTFHAGHQLHNHQGQCARPHGHTYKLEVHVEGPILRVDGRSDGGMVVDFQVIKDIYEEHIEPLVEHQDLNVTLFEVVPATTCEHVAAWALTIMRTEFAKRSGRALNGPFVRKVTLWETPTSYAEVT